MKNPEQKYQIFNKRERKKLIGKELTLSEEVTMFNTQLYKEYASILNKNDEVKEKKKMVVNSTQHQINFDRPNNIFMASNMYNEKE